MVCRPGSYVAHDMVRDCILDRNRPYGLHRLGVTMHVYIDTWAHYGFCGTAHEINRANDITTLNADGSEIRDRNIKERLTGFFRGGFDFSGGFSTTPPAISSIPSSRSVMARS